MDIEFIDLFSCLYFSLSCLEVFMFLLSIINSLQYHRNQRKVTEMFGCSLLISKCGMDYSGDSWQRYDANFRKKSVRAIFAFILSKTIMLQQSF